VVIIRFLEYMKPQLPYSITQMLPSEIVHLINTFVPHLPKQKPVSPNLERELKHIQVMQLKGKKNTFMRGLEDFML
jgi:hypothetical protein